LVDRDEWLEFKCDPADIRKETNRIRAAGQHLKIGTEVRADKETGRIAFRGCEYKPRVRQAPDTAPPVVTQPAAQPPVQASDQDQGQAPAQSAGTAWDWQASPR